MTTMTTKMMTMMMADDDNNVVMSVNMYAECVCMRVRRVTMVQDFDLDHGLLECLALRVLDPMGAKADKFEEEAWRRLWADDLTTDSEQEGENTDASADDELLEALLDA